MVTTCLLSALAAALLQQPDAQAPAGITDAAAQLHRALVEQRSVLFSTPEPDGTTWARGGNYKVCLANGGWTFVPQPPAGAERLEPLQFRVVGVRVGGLALAVGAPSPVRSEQRFVYDHGGFAETVDVAFDGVEQQFVFGELPARGAIEVRIAATGIAARADAGGIVFDAQGGPVTYSAAVAIDAVGRRVAAPTALAADGGQIVIRVPAEFVASAVLPLTIDPAVAFAVPQTANTDLADPDVCCSRVTTQLFPMPVSQFVWTVVYANYFGATDWDCYVINYDTSLTPLSGPYVIDISTDGWARPRIASVGISPALLVVAQVRSGSSVNRIRACRCSFVNASLAIGSPFNVSNDTVDCSHPDVGGDATPFLFLAEYFTIVWERAFSATDHDIYMRQVDHNGTLLAGPYPIQTNTLNQSNPAISKSCGSYIVNSTEDRVSAIVYQERAAPGNEDIHGTLITANGQQIVVNGGYTFPIDASFHNDINPTVSSPTLRGPDGYRRLLVAWERTSSSNGDIVAACLRSDGLLLAQGNVTMLENDPSRLNWPQRRPSVDSDGVRFGVAYHEVYAGNTTVNDLDTRMSLVALAESAPGGPALVVAEAAAILGFSGNREFNVEVASVYSGSGVGTTGYCTTNDRDNTNNTFAIDVRTYTAVPAITFTTRATGCGSATITPSGLTQIGATATFTVNANALFAGIAIGDPVAVPIGGCTGCTLGVGNGVILASPYGLAVPANATLIGAQLSAQGIVLVASGGTCLGSLQLTDTIDFRVQ